MGINVGSQELVDVLIGTKDVSVYIGEEQIWPVLDNICFSNGFWVDEYPWDDNFYWRD